MYLNYNKHRLSKEQRSKLKHIFQTNTNINISIFQNYMIILNVGYM